MHIFVLVLSKEVEDMEELNLDNILGAEEIDNLFMDEEELQVVIMKQRMGVKIEGSICYVSDNVTVTDVDAVSPLKDDDGKTIENMGDDYIVVIYK